MRPHFLHESPHCLYKSKLNSYTMCMNRKVINAHKMVLAYSMQAFTYNGSQRITVEFKLKKLKLTKLGANQEQNTYAR
jgi:hypothetical protein